MSDWLTEVIAFPIAAVIAALLLFVLGLAIVYVTLAPWGKRYG